ncbi:hypothetical protein PCE1_000488 [Barthelona sp. PCE]
MLIDHENQNNERINIEYGPELIEQLIEKLKLKFPSGTFAKCGYNHYVGRNHYGPCGTCIYLCPVGSTGMDFVELDLTNIPENDLRITIAYCCDGMPSETLHEFSLTEFREQAPHLTDAIMQSEERSDAFEYMYNPKRSNERLNRKWIEEYIAQ